MNTRYLAFIQKKNFYLFEIRRKIKIKLIPYSCAVFWIRIYSIIMRIRILASSFLHLDPDPGVGPPKKFTKNYIIPVPVYVYCN